MLWAYALITVVFAVTTLVFCGYHGANMVERPDGLKIAGCFIATVLIVSLISRVMRAYDALPALHPVGARARSRRPPVHVG